MHLSTNFYLQTPPQEHLAVWELHTSPTVRVEPLQPNGCGKDIKSYQETKGFAEQSQPCTSFFPNFSWGQLDRGRAMVGKLSWCAHREQGCSWPRWGCELCFNTTQTPRAKRSLKVTQEMTKRERKQRSEGARPKKKRASFLQLPRGCRFASAKSPPRSEAEMPPSAQGSLPP